MKSSIAAGILGLALVTAHAQAPSTLDIYWVDVEGGAATLIVTPARESILMDAGWDTADERDANRIVQAMNDAGIDTIDYFIASHFHADHVGGVPALARRVPIGQYIDHGNSVEVSGEPGPWERYMAVASAKRQAVEPGDTLDLSGIDFTFVVANRAVPSSALVDTGPNAHCANASPGEDLRGENASSVGYLLSLGEFEFLNLGDLTVNNQHRLACPENLLGVIDLFQVPHHGNGVAAQLTWALAPTVAVLNNGARKGGSPEGFEAVDTIPGLAGLWQVHRALGTDDAHNVSERMTANPSEANDAGYWIKATVRADGQSYTIVNQRNGYSETYATK